MTAKAITPDDWIEIGRIVAPQGIKGEVRVYPSSDFPERFLEPGERWLKRPRSLTPELVELVRGRSVRRANCGGRQSRWGRSPA